MADKTEKRNPGILAKLLLVNLLIIAAFSIIALSVEFSFRNIDSYSGTIITRDVNEVVRNAQLGRNLSVVFAESDRLISTFMNREIDIRRDGDRIIGWANAMEKEEPNPKLRDALRNYIGGLDPLFSHCIEVRGFSLEMESREKEFEKELDSLERVLSRKLIGQGAEGRDVPILKQISLLLLGYREILLQISVRQTRIASTHPEAFNARDGDLLLAQLKELKLKLRPLTVSEPFVRAHGARLISCVRGMETATEAFQTGMDELSKRLLRLRIQKDRVVSAMKDYDRGVFLTADRMRGNISHVMNSSRLLILATSATVVACLLLFTFMFSYRDIRRPIEIIRQGLESIRGGDLDTTIRLNRSDEWGEIERSLNSMVKELKGSYQELQEKNLELELTQSDLEEKVAELESEMTERHKAEDALWENEQRLHATLRGMPIPILVIDGDLRVIYWNRALEQMSGIRGEEVVGTDRAWTAFYKEDRPLLAGLLAKGDLESIPLWYEGKYSKSPLVEGAYEVTDYFPDMGGIGRWLHITAAVLRDENGRLIGAIETVEDISEHRHLEEQLRHSQKMDAIGQLAGGVAHDFNNILTGILGFGNMLQLKIGGEDKRIRRYVDQIVESAEKGANLTQTLLAFSRKHDIGQKGVNLNEIILRTRKFLSRLVSEDIELQVDLGDDCIIMADSLQIEQVLMNLVTNSRDAMPEGGRLTISTRQVALDEDFVRVRGLGEPGRFAMISVSDTGCGMDEKTREKVFEPFFTTKEAGKGTGLGLSIVYGIIKQHRGSLDLRSEPGKGTTFDIYLPLVTDYVREGEETDEETPIPGGSETILLADDDPIVRSLAKELLQEYGYMVVDAEDGEEALTKFLSHKDEISLAILDVVMPKKNGREVYGEIRNHRPDLKVLFISGYTGDVLTRRGMLEKDVDFISKPYVQSSLLRKVRDVLDG